MVAASAQAALGALDPPCTPHTLLCQPGLSASTETAESRLAKEQQLQNCAPFQHNTPEAGRAEVTCLSPVDLPLWF